MILLLIILTSVAAAQDITPPEVEGAGFHQTILLSYSQWMDDDVLEKLNYEMFNSSLRLVDIANVERVDTHLVHLSVPVLPYKVEYVIRVSNVHNIGGDLLSQDKNSAWIFFNGFDSTSIQSQFNLKRN